MVTPKGHVFVVFGDLLKIACDAWLLPSDQSCLVESVWRENKSRSIAELCDQARREPFKSDEWSRPLSWPSAPRSVATKRVGFACQPWLTDVALSKRNPRPNGYLHGVQAFLTQCARRFSAQPEAGRLPLVALPLVGTGRGGWGLEPDCVLRDLLPVLTKASEQHAMNIALVLKSEEAYCAAQACRAAAMNHLEAGLKPVEGEALQRLADYAASNHLVVFAGAGVSAYVGLPTWHELLDVLLKEVVTDPAQQAAIQSLDRLDQAAVLQSLDPNLGAKVRVHIEPHRDYALLHALLASLPITEYVTTNYDCLLDRALEDALALAPLAALSGHSIEDGSERLAVLPHDAHRDAARWLVKLHGSEDQQQDIVLSRADYLRYSDRRAALRGLVQGLLMTRELLFVGFSMTDDNFHHIADEVRKALGQEKNPGPKQRFGTVATAVRHRGVEQLWGEELSWVHFVEDDSSLGPSAPTPAALQRQLVFFDLLAHKTARAKHALHPQFQSLLTPPEQEMARSLVSLPIPPGIPPNSALAEGFRAFLRAHGDHRHDVPK